MEMIEVAIFGTGKRAGDLLVRVVTPRRRIGRGTGKRADGKKVTEFPAIVAAVDCAQAGCPRQVNSANTGHVWRVGAVIAESEGVGAIDEVGQRRRSGAGKVGGTGIEISAPEPVEVPVGAGDAGHVRINH